MERIARSKSEKTHLYKLSRKENNIYIYNLNMSVINTGVGRKCCFGSTPLSGTHKTIMLVGPTGSGKTTLINAMINYILGVKQKDPVRFELVPKESDQSQAHSQTSEITAYQINHCKDFAIDFSLTIIDTPGFGDTRGIAKDKEIVDKVREFFSAKDGISSIDAVGFVTQSALVRLTPTQKYIFDSILSIFGKDIEDNIVLLATFADGQVPHVLQAIQEAKIPCARNKKGIPICLKFNNSALFASNDEAGTGDKAGTDDEAGTDDRDEVLRFEEMFWKMGTVSIKNLFHRLNCLEAQSLQLTKEVLSERKKLETTVEGLQHIIQVGLINLDKLKKEQKALENHRDDAEKNKNFEFEVDVPKIEKVPLQTGIHTTTCRNCNFTCHGNCVYSIDIDKSKCCAITNGSCTNCPGKCHWSHHSNLPYKFVYSSTTETRTYQHLKEKYEKAFGAKLSAAQVVQQLKEDYRQTQQTVFNDIKKLSDIQKRLGEIALRPNPLSATDYIDLIIESEKQEHKPGFLERIQELNKCREGADLIKKVSNNEKLLPDEKEKDKDGGFRTWFGKLFGGAD